MQKSKGEYQMDFETLKKQALAGDMDSEKVYMDAMMGQGFEKALEAFLGCLNESFKAFYSKHYPMLPGKTAEVAMGSKYAKVIAKDSSRCVYCFVNKQTGEIFKPASWAAPAKHARGNIFSSNPIACCGPYGIEYLRGGMNIKF
jgi:hypothetical protein